MPSKPLVAVTWLDAHGSATAELEEHELPSEPARYTTYGLLVKDCAAGIVVASEETQNRTYRGWTFVPRGMVVDIKYLEKKRGGVRKRREKLGAETQVRPDSRGGADPGSGADG